MLQKGQESVSSQKFNETIENWCDIEQRYTRIFGTNKSSRFFPGVVLNDDGYKLASELELQLHNTYKT